MTWKSKNTTATIGQCLILRWDLQTTLAHRRTICPRILSYQLLTPSSSNILFKIRHLVNTDHSLSLRRSNMKLVPQHKKMVKIQHWTVIGKNAWSVRILNLTDYRCADKPKLSAKPVCRTKWISYFRIGKSYLIIMTRIIVEKE